MVRNLALEEQRNLKAEKESPRVEEKVKDPEDRHDPKLKQGLMQNPHRPLSRERLIELARGPSSETDSRSMDVQVSRVRKLIEPDPSRPRYLQTVWGYGYVFVPDGEPRQKS